MEKLFAQLSVQQVVLDQQNEALKSGEDDLVFLRGADQASSSNSVPVTPATDAFPTTAPTTRPASANIGQTRPDHEEVLHLKLQLAQAQNHISKLDLELSQNRNTKPDIELPAMNGPKPMGLIPREGSWMTSDDVQSDSSEAVSSSTMSRARNIWGNSKNPFPGPAMQGPMNEHSSGTWFGARSLHQTYVEPNVPYPASDGFRGDRLAPDSDLLMRPNSGRRSNRYDSRLNPPHSFSHGYGPFSPSLGQFDTMGGQMQVQPINMGQVLGPMGGGMCSPYQQQPIGTPLSPHASEFTSKAGWKSDVSSIHQTSGKVG